ncbi:hypothetical protein ACP4B2_27565 [Streptomyces rochei]|uniref:hypothetical protein n=1 Tax=Streptomyces rochei TaxID=1928 RepID=UPI003D29A037
MKTNPISQHGAAVALVQLLEEFPDLPKLAWRLPENEFLSGALYGSGPRMDDPRPTAMAWAEALGAEVVEKPFLFEHTQHVEFAVETVWRDVPVRIYLSCPASVLPVAAEAVAA